MKAAFPLVIIASVLMSGCPTSHLITSPQQDTSALDRLHRETRDRASRGPDPRRPILAGYGVGTGPGSDTVIWEATNDDSARLQCILVGAAEKLLADRFAFEHVETLSPSIHKQIGCAA
jgi:hypothetical protein